jgi:site-specific recombinase XerD
MLSSIEEWINSHPKVAEWLELKRSNYTKRDYAERLYNFCFDNKTTPEALLTLNEKDAKHLIQKYYAERESNEKVTNTTLNTVTALRGFFAYHFDHKLNFPNGTFAKPQPDTDSHNFSTPDLKLIFGCGSVTERAIISMSTSLGWEISAILGLEHKKIADLIVQARANKQDHIFFEDVRHKRKESRLGIINTLAIEWVSKYLETAEPTEKLFDYSEQGLNKILKKLVRKSGIKTTGRIHFHRIRAWHESTLFGAGFNPMQVDYIQGHALGAQRRTYYTELRQQIEEKYPLVYHEKLDISNGNGTETKRIVSNLATENAQLKLQLEDAKKTIEEMKNQQNTMSKSIGDFQKFQDIVEKKLNIKQKVPID